jgi:hypothetical protein
VIAAIGAGVVAAVLGAARHGEEDPIRTLAADTIRRMEPIGGKDTAVGAWLRRTAGWNEIDVEFFDVELAMPTGPEVGVWMEVSPPDYDNFVEIVRNARESGGTVHSALVENAGVDRVERRRRAALSPRPGEGPNLLEVVSRRRYARRAMAIAYYLECGDYRRARTCLREYTPELIDW